MKSLEAPLPDKPSDKHTKLITCQKPGCGKKRWVKPQDVWQVKLCRWCKDEEKRTKSKVSLARLKERVEVREFVARETDWLAIRRAGHEAGMLAVTAYRGSKQYKVDMATLALEREASMDLTPMRRIWPR